MRGTQHERYMIEAAVLFVTAEPRTVSTPIAEALYSGCQPAGQRPLLGAIPKRLVNARCSRYDPELTNSAGEGTHGGRPPKSIEGGTRGEVRRLWCRTLARGSELNFWFGTEPTADRAPRRWF